MKKLSLLSLLLSTNCLASGPMGIANLGTAILAMAATGFTVYFLANLLLIICFSRLIQKDKITPLKTLASLSFLSTLLWCGLGIVYQFITHLDPSAVVMVPLILASSLLAALPLFRWYAPNMRAHALPMMLFVYFLNPVQWLLILSVINSLRVF